MKMIEKFAAAVDAAIIPAAGWNTPAERQEVYIPLAVWSGDKNAGGGGPTVSAEEALSLGAIPGSINLAEGTANWPEAFWA